MGQLTQTTAEVQQILDGVYGAMQISSAATAFDPAVNDTPEIFTAWEEAGLSNNMTVDVVTNNEIVATVAGTYRVDFSCSFNVAGGATETVKFYLYHDDGTPARFGSGIERTIGGTSVGSACCGGEIALSVNDSVQVWIETTDAGKNITLEEASLFVHRVGE